MSEAEMTLIMKLFDKSPLLVMCVFLYFGFVVPQRKKATEEVKAAPAPAAIVQQYDDSVLIRSIERVEHNLELTRTEMKVDLATAKGEILEQVSRLDGIVTQSLLDDRRASIQQHRKGQSS